ncbi:hypothetical protein ALC56_10686 [Trachymyrmex septentrionalis]|uniref:Ig-like domain-containing protein n=1 Tax=Trachymyrmex septentrionalis TaxID=34720 RepID=A0A195F4E7_9HYME|nr:hypothetical protein ALC56_10686 [Trachymyrmex septentrionalis]
MQLQVVLFTLQVSWMRKRDMHILSAGIFMYTSDLRFQVIHPDKSENWTLQIKSPQQRDSGVYECQVSTEPKMSLNYSLNVVGEYRLYYLFVEPGYVNCGLDLILFEVLSRMADVCYGCFSIGCCLGEKIVRDTSRLVRSNGLKFKRLSAPSWDYPLDVASCSKIPVV